MDEERHQEAVEMLLTSLLIQSARNYDVLLSILMRENVGAAAELREMHERGELWAPPPSFVMDEEDEA